MMLKLKWLGEESTMIAPERGGVKVEVKKGGTIEVEEEHAKGIKKAYRDQIEIVGLVKDKEPKKDKVETQEVKKDKVEKG